MRPVGGVKAGSGCPILALGAVLVPPAGKLLQLVGPECQGQIVGAIDRLLERGELREWCSRGRL